MRWDRIQEGWSQLGKQVRTRWGRLNASDLQTIGGDRDSLLDTLCARYELPRKAAEWQITAWQNAYSDRWLYDSHDDPAAPQPALHDQSR